MSEVFERMHRDPHRLALIVTRAFAGAAVVALVGCATEGPTKLADLEQKIRAARTRADHEAIAALYEQQADKDKVAAERHRGLALAYERGWVWSGPRVGSASSEKKEKQSAIAHCENLVRIYAQAAEENLVLSRQHRQLGVDMKD